MIDTKRIAKLREFLAGVREEYELRGWRYCGEPEAVQDLLTLLEEAQIKAGAKSACATCHGTGKIDLGQHYVWENSRSRPCPDCSKAAGPGATELNVGTSSQKPTCEICKVENATEIITSCGYGGKRKVCADCADGVRLFNKRREGKP